MGSVLETDQKLAETCAETVETTATRSFNLSADNPTLQDSQQVSKVQPVLAPYSQIRTCKE